MTRSIIAGYDGSDAARAAIGFAGRLAEMSEAELTVATVVRSVPQVVGAGWAMSAAVEANAELEAELVAEGQRMLDELPGDDLVRRTVVADSPAHGLQWLAREQEAELLCIGTTHRGTVGRHVPGSVASHLLHGAPCPVCVVPASTPADAAIAKIGVAFDDRPESRVALATAERLASAAGATLVLIGVAEPVVIPAAIVDLSRWQIEESVHQHLQNALERAAEEVSCPVETRTLRGEAAEQLQEVTGSDIDMLVIGSRAFGPVRSVLLGSVSRAVVEHARCPVVVVPRSATADDESPRTAEAAKA
jgi:nucleotide-binding universal stress UspA family protein